MKKKQNEKRRMIEQVFWGPWHTKISSTYNGQRRNIQNKLIWKKYVTHILQERPRYKQQKHEFLKNIIISINKKSARAHGCKEWEKRKKQIYIQKQRLVRCTWMLLILKTLDNINIGQALDITLEIGWFKEFGVELDDMRLWRKLSFERELL